MIILNGILIVDDQKDVRDEIEDMLVKMNIGFDKILHADRAQAAIELIRRQAPDILLLDIVMPGNDGFVVAQYIHDNKIRCEIIIMTAFPELDFALKAVKYKTAAFLIKPIQPEKLQYEILEILKADKSERQKQLDLKQHNHLYYRMLDVYLSSPASDLSFDKIRANTGLDQINADYQMIFLADSHKSNPAHEKLSHLARTLADMDLANIYYLHADTVFVFIIGTTGYASQKLLNDLTEKIGACFSSFSAGLSCQRREIGIKAIYSQATFAFDYARRLRVENTIVCYNAINIAQALFQRHKDSIYAACLQNDVHLYENAVDELFIDLNRNRVNAGNAYAQWSETFRGLSLADMPDAKADYTLNQLRALAISLFQARRHDSPVVPQKVGQILKYVAQNYYKSLNLTTIANEMNLNYSYASTMFKRCTGSSFTDYLTRYRLAKAAEMLENTNCFIYEVAGKVGFTDSKYFFRLFKTVYGLTPGQYHETRSGGMLCEGRLEHDQKN